MASKLNPYLAHMDEPDYQPEKRWRYKLDSIPHKNTDITIKSTQFSLGNYKDYYSYRRTDRRIVALNKDWITGNCLDIGCNSGVLTIEMCKLFHPASMEGVDIDPNLISKARYNQVWAKSLASVESTTSDDVDYNYFPVSCPIQLGITPILHNQAACETPDLLSNLYFRCGDWVHESVRNMKYQVIFAFSITKWIHLNNGDGGLRFFFNKCFASLLDGGLLILEPQPWEGYAKRAGLSDIIRDNYLEISFFPSMFLNFLVSKVGFKLIECLQPDSDVKGFKRAIYVLEKPTTI